MPGPCYVHSYTHDSHSVLTEASGHEVAHCRTRRNAEFFAAAPDVLFSLKAMVAAMIEFTESLSETNQAARRALIAEAQAAINKAEGQS